MVYLRIIVLFLYLFSISSCGPEPPTKNDRHNATVVIGGGLMGSATAYFLAKEGQPVILYEKQDSIYTSGSSQGEARIARSSNRGDDIWSYMHNTSVHHVKELIVLLQKAYPDKAFDISDIYTTNPVSYLGRMSIHDKLLASLIRQKVDYKMATTPAEGKALFGANLQEGVLLQREYNQHSGMINPRVLIEYLHLAIKSMGGDVRYGHRIDSLIQVGDHFQIRITDDKNNVTINEAHKIVSAAGPYTGELLGSVAPYFDDLINPQRVFLAFYKLDKAVYNSLSIDDRQKLLDAYPVINSSKGTRDGTFFSMIEYFDESGVPVIKIGGHFQRSEILDLDAIWTKNLTEDEKSWALNSTATYFQQLNLSIEKDDFVYDHGYSCVYSLTDNEVPLVTPIKDANGQPNFHLIVLGGMSGVGAKGAMTYGMIGADLSVTQKGVDDHKHVASDTMYSHVKERLGFKRLTSE